MIVTFRLQTVVKVRHRALWC